MEIHSIARNTCCFQMFRPRLSLFQICMVYFVITCMWFWALFRKSFSLHINFFSETSSWSCGWNAWNSNTSFPTEWLHHEDTSTKWTPRSWQRRLNLVCNLKLSLVATQKWGEKLSLPVWVQDEYFLLSFWGWGGSYTQARVS